MLGPLIQSPMTSCDGKVHVKRSKWGKGRDFISTWKSLAQSTKQGTAVSLPGEYNLSFTGQQMQADVVPMTKARHLSKMAAPTHCAWLASLRLCLWIWAEATEEKEHQNVEFEELSSHPSPLNSYIDGFKRIIICKWLCCWLCLSWGQMVSMAYLL